MGCILCILSPVASFGPEPVLKYVRVFPILCLLIFIQLIQDNTVYTIPKCYNFKSLFHHRTVIIYKKKKFLSPGPVLLSCPFLLYECSHWNYMAGP